MEKLAGSAAIAELIHQTKAALRGKQNTLHIDTAPTAGSANPVSSGGVYTALRRKQDILRIDTAPTADSVNPVSSGGVKAALDELQRQIPHYADGDEVSY